MLGTRATVPTTQERHGRKGSGMLKYTCERTLVLNLVSELVHSETLSVTVTWESDLGGLEVTRHVKNWCVCA